MSEFAPFRSRRRAFAGHDVTVVGAGMAGAAAALSLAQAGLDVALIEARELKPWQLDDPMDLRVVALAPSSVHLLRELGVWENVRQQRAQPYRRMFVWDAANGGAFTMDASEQGLQALGYIVENRLVQHQLWQALQMAGVSVFCPVSVEQIDAREASVTIHLSDGRCIETRTLIAADGGHSPLREMAGIKSRGHEYGQRAVVAHVATEKAHEDTAWQHFIEGGSLAFLPLQNGRSSVVWSLPEQQAKQMQALDDAAFCQELGAAMDMRLGRVVETSARASFPLRLNLARNYRTGRVVLLGDAAHTIHPMAGQGINLGLRDVAALRRIVRTAQETGRDVNSEQVLARYARDRVSANTLNARSLDMLASIYAWQAFPLVTLRGLGMRMVNGLTPLKQHIVKHASGL